MADTGQRSGRTSTGGTYDVVDRSGWTVWVLFAGVMMIMMGSLHAITGLVALFQDDYYAVGSSGLVISVDYTGWGWVHLLLGILVAGAGVAVMFGQIWARTLGVILALVSAITNMLFIAAYPLWSIILITLDVIVIYSLIVHGHELKED